MPEPICIDQALSLAPRGERFEVFLELTPDAVVVTDARGFVLAANGRAQELLPGAGRARHRAQLLSYFDSSSHLALEVLRRARTSAGRPPLVALASTPIEEYQAEASCAELGPDELLWVFRDVTDREWAQLQLEASMECQRIAEEHMSSVEEMHAALVFGVARDLHSPLTAMAAYADLLDRPGLTSEGDWIVQHLAEAVRSTLRVVTNLLDRQRFDDGPLPLCGPFVDLTAGECVEERTQR